MIDFETAQRLIRIHERLKQATYREIRRDGHHKRSEAAMELSFHLPNAFGGETEWSVWAYSYLLCPDGRSQRWSGKTPQEAISKAEDEIGRWCEESEFQQFAEDMGEVTA